MNRFLNNNDIMTLFQFGETSQIPNFDDSKSIKLLKRLKPKNFNELCNIYSLNRFGVENNLRLYIKNKINPEKIEYDFPFFEENLKETFGVLIYSEQYVKIIQDFSGLTSVQSEIIRKVMGMKLIDLMNKYYIFYKESCLKNELLVEWCVENDKIINLIIDDFWDYIFNNGTSIIRLSAVINAVSESYNQAFEQTNNSLFK